MLVHIWIIIITLIIFLKNERCYDHSTIFEIENIEDNVKQNTLEPFILQSAFHNFFSHNKIEVNVLLIDVKINEINSYIKFENFSDFKSSYYQKTSLLNKVSKNANKINQNSLSEEDRSI